MPTEFCERKVIPREIYDRMLIGANSRGFKGTNQTLELYYFWSGLRTKRLARNH